MEDKKKTYIINGTLKLSFYNLIFWEKNTERYKRLVYQASQHSRTIVVISHISREIIDRWTIINWIFPACSVSSAKLPSKSVVAVSNFSDFLNTLPSDQRETCRGSVSINKFIAFSLFEKKTKQKLFDFESSFTETTSF